MKTEDFFSGLTPNLKKPGVNIENTDNNKIINEAIILDELGGSKSALLEFYSNLGTFGVRDGVLNESAAIDIKLSAFNECAVAETSAILAVAKESDDEDYALYNKAMLLMSQAMDNMKAKYEATAQTRLLKQTAEVQGNSRIQSAVEKVIG